MTNEQHNTSNDQHEKAYHIPVLLRETIEALQVKPDGTYVDCTFGGGGHSRALLAELGEKGRLIAFDQDEDARRNLPDDPRLIFIPQNFRHLQRMLKWKEIGEVDGLLADLGVSSYQFDEASRGFSTRFNAEMDMRMDRRQKLTAFDVLNSFTAGQLQEVFGKYGEVTNAKTLARTIVEKRATQSLKTIEGFRNAVSGVVKGNPNKYFAQVFQALRIEVNDELGALRDLLLQVPAVLKPGGRAAIITFHSLEDRLVKNFFRRGSFDEPEEHPFLNRPQANELVPVNKKPITPTEKEMKSNPRSRSAKLRVAEKRQRA